ncbi:hypothetical protein F975_01503 [Acinetobacter sp. ANC 3789]|uniref:defense against restriction DarA-related protein n=1 Tax=Acinetobacter sp. ANC 3789 TaxID=1217714 RepID=UPI0002CF35D8|nr:hypothetical protein [Acinetobacter sp. ANC 3789]ENU80449.1 hypothetical protein F975_01503 [Acinetobacter sp. ANC 3789]
MKNTKNFIQQYAPHMGYVVAGFDAALNTGSCSIGCIQGTHRKLSAIVTESATEDDLWHVVNFKSQQGFDSCAVLGVSDGDEAKNIAHLYFGRMFDGVVTDVMLSNEEGLKRHLDNAYFHRTKDTAIQPWQLEKFQDVIAGEQPMWDGLQLKSHSGSLAHLLSDMQFHDDHNGLLNQFDGLPALLEALDAEHQEFDSIIIDYQHLEKFSNMLSKAMDLAAKGGVAITSMEMSKPFKRKNVVNVAVTYNIADGQNVTIVYHNPDSTPSKLAATDTLISWKIMLNNRDVTGAIQPNQGEGIALPILAGRIMQLVNKNSARFQRTQAKKAEAQQGLTDAQGRLTDKQSTLKALDTEIEALKLQLDEVVASNPEDQNNKPEPKFSQDDMITLTVSSMGKLHLWMRIWTRLFIWLS